MQHEEEKSSLVLGALPLGYTEPPLKDHCNLTEHKAEKLLIPIYLGYISLFLALFGFDYDALFKTVVTKKSLFPSISWVFLVRMFYISCILQRLSFLSKKKDEGIAKTLSSSL